MPDITSLRQPSGSLLLRQPGGMAPGLDAVGAEVAASRCDAPDRSDAPILSSPLILQITRSGVYYRTARRCADRRSRHRREKAPP
jgi:hypothetical protein